MHSIAPDADPAPVSPSLALAPYAERLVEGRRVVVFGDASTGLGPELAARGARLVHVYDPDPGRVSEALVTRPARGVSYAQLTEGDLGVRDGAFDVAIIPDLSLFSDAKGVISRLRRVASPQGVAIVASPHEKSGGPLGYYDLYDALSLQFAEVRMAGQVPFRGLALVDFGAAGEPSVSVDTSLAESVGNEPDGYVCIASDGLLSIDGYAIVQLPGEERPRRDAGLLRELEQNRVALAEAQAGVAAARAELETLREVRRAAEARLADEQRRAADYGRALAEAESIARQLQAKLVEEGSRAEVSGGQMAKLREQADRAARDLAAQKDRAQQLTRALAEAQAEVQRQEAEAQQFHAEAQKSRELPGEVARLRAREQALVERVRRLESEPRGVDAAAHEALRRDAEIVAERLARAEGELRAIHDSHAEEISAAEGALRERAREIALLRHEVDRRGGMVRELLDALEARGADAGGLFDPGRQALLDQELSALRAQSESLAAQIARRDAELSAAHSRIHQLDVELRARTATPEGASTDERIVALSSEIDALRRALLQEREARARAEAKNGTEADPFSSVLLHQVGAERSSPG